MISALEKSLAVNPFGNEIIVIDNKPEVVQKVEIDIDKSLEKVFDYCENVVMKYDPKDSFIDYLTGRNSRYHILKKIREVLNPVQIQFLSQRLLLNQDYNWHSLIPDLFSILMQKCYGKTNKTDFMLETGVGEVDELCNSLKDKKNIGLLVNIIGNVGNQFGWGSRGVNFTIDGNVLDKCGEDSNNCNYTITGNAETDFGVNSKKCNYIIYGNVGDACGSKSNDCTYTIEGTMGSRFAEFSKRSTYNIASIHRETFSYHFKDSDPKKCIFATQKKEVYNKLLRYIPMEIPKENGNKARLIGKNNIVLEEVQV